MFIKSMLSRSNNSVPNQFTIEINGITYFQSYKTIIAKWSGTKIILDAQKWDYSRTTLKYLCQFLGVKSKKEIEQNIKTGNYKLGKLNQY